jgi:hypothetical protein
VDTNELLKENKLKLSHAYSSFVLSQSLRFFGVSFRAWGECGENQSSKKA